MDSAQKKKGDAVARMKKQLAELKDELRQKDRQLEIESALEQVRVRATAMRVSSELAETSAVLFHQLNALNIKAIRTAVGIIDDANDAMELWLTTYSDSDEVIRILDFVNLHIHPVYENIIPARRAGKPYAMTRLEGEAVRHYYQTMSTYIKIPRQQKHNPAEYYYSFFFSGGALNIVSRDALGEEACSIMVRFANVFGLIYTRFLDLQNAEARARDLLKQTSLDRVRAEIASMRSTLDLQRIGPLVWNELTKLGVPFSRCGLFIMDESQQQVRIFLSDPEGNSLATLNMPVSANLFLRDLVNHWKNHSVYTAHWTKEDFDAWTKSVVDQGQVTDETTYRNATHPPDELDIHFIPFSQGMLYIGNEYPVTDVDLLLSISLADAFSIAYARYEDFIQLEKAKQRVESTLTELKATQTQLIQSEKMASLGELTAGIAHEIKNPLNFVNNFSEVNKELVGELNEALSAGKTEEAISIAKNIAENEEKIIFHGKRADEIVKGMLQHSRSGSGQKELTDINVLADEYLRLSYHGMRAKDKTFNAKMETHFGEDLPMINIVRQDIGRVLLNLFTNAFYSVTKKAQEQGAHYQPTVTVHTSRVDHAIKVSVRDNGNGVPDKVMEKIFQPFFTTKPVGEGTGLGLSISYDIVTKGHNGEIKLESRPGEYAEFIIILPFKAE
jgi:signal transduction histidine kinase